MFQAVFFDMDGLFIDSEPDWHSAELDLMRAFGYDWTPEDQLHCLGGPLTRVTEYMSKCLKGAKSSEELGELIIEEMSKRLSTTVPLMTGAMEFSRELNKAGIPQALVFKETCTLSPAKETSSPKQFPKASPMLVSFSIK